MSYDDQYDTPLTGPERARIEALNLTSSRLYDTVEKWVEAAGKVEQFIIGQRATAVREQINAAYNLADRILREADRANPTVDPWTGAPDVRLVDAAQMREPVVQLSRLSDGAPF